MRLKSVAAPLGLVLLAALVMSFRLGSKDLWNDEAFSFFVAHRGAASALRFISSDTQPPFYYVVLSYWLRFGHGVLVLRSLSVLAMVLAVLPLYAAARRLFDAPTAAVAGLLFVLTPLITSWAQKARPYPLQTLFLAMAFWGFIEVFCAPEARRDSIGHGVAQTLRTGQLRAARVDLGWLAYGLGSGIAMLTQEPAGFFVLGCNVAILLATLQRLKDSRRFLLNWTIAQLVGIAVWASWLPELFHQMTTNLTPKAIATGHPNFLVTGRDVWAELVGLFGVGSLWRAEAPFLLVQLLLGLIGAALLIRERQALPLLAPLLVPFAVCLPAFVLVHPVFGYVITTFIFTWITFSILLAYAIVHMPLRSVGSVLFGLVLVGDLWGLRNYYETPTPPIAAVAQVIRRDLRPGDGVVFAQDMAMRWGIAYYLGPSHRDELSGLGVSAWRRDNEPIRTPEMALRHPRVWVVLPGGNERPSFDINLLRPGLECQASYRIGDATVLLFRANGS